MRFYKNLSKWDSEKLLDYSSTIYSLAFTNHNDEETLADIRLILLQRIEGKLTHNPDAKSVITELLRDAEAAEESF